MTAWRWSIIAAAALAATAALADGLTDSVVAQLQQQGYTKVTISRTLLGRIRILGSNAEGQREIVLNPNTGEILRDYQRPRYAANEDGSGDTTRTIVEREPTTPDAGDDPGTEKPGGKGTDGSKGTGKGNGGTEGGSQDANDGETATGDDGPAPSDNDANGKSTEGGTTLPGVVETPVPEDPATDPAAGE